MKTKANLSLQTIVVAVLVLFVLAVLIYMTSNFLGGFSTQGKSCTLAGGECASGRSACDGATVIPEPEGGWAKNGESSCNVCCSFNPLKNDSMKR